MSGGGCQTTAQERESRWSPVVSLRMQQGGQGGCSSQGRVLLRREQYRKGEGQRKERAGAGLGYLQMSPQVF